MNIYVHMYSFIKSWMYLFISKCTHCLLCIESSWQISRDKVRESTFWITLQPYIWRVRGKTWPISWVANSFLWLSVPCWRNCTFNESIQSSTQHSYLLSLDDEITYLLYDIVAEHISHQISSMGNDFWEYLHLVLGAGSFEFLLDEATSILIRAKW